MSRWNHTSDTILLSVLMCAALVVYFVGLQGPFVFDDKPNLLDNPFIQVTSLNPAALKNAALSNQNHFFHRSIPMVSFALNYYFAGGFSELHFKSTNLVIHILNGLLIYFLARRITATLVDSKGISAQLSVLGFLPFVVSAYWLLHPLQLTSVLHVVQRMNSMSAFFVLAGLIIFVDGRIRFEQRKPRGITLMTLGVVGGTTLGVLCKENAALLPIYAGVLELTCFSRHALDASGCRKLKLFYWAAIGLPLLLACIFAATRPGIILEPYRSRSFTLIERALTQPRVLFYYLRLVFFPLRGDMSLFHDDFPVSSGLNSPPTTLIAIGVWVVLVIAAVLFRRRSPVLFFSVSWFLVGHAMESSILGLELVHEHRNYLPLLGPVFGMTYAILFIFERIQADRRIVIGILCAVAVTAGFVTHSRALTWSSEERLISTLAKDRPSSPRAVGYLADLSLRIRGDFGQSFELQQRYARHVPASVNGLIQMLRILALLKHSQALVLDERTSEFHSTSALTSPLPTSKSELESLERAINDEILSRLKTQPIIASTISTIQTLSGCIFQGEPICVSFAKDLAAWIDAALGNPNISRAHHFNLFLNGSKIQGWLGNLRKSVIYAEFAAAAGRERVHAYIQLVELHYVLGNFEKSRDYIKKLKKIKNLPSAEAKAVDNLEFALKKK